MSWIALIIGVACLCTCGWFGRRAGMLEEQLIPYRTRFFQRFEGRWPAPPDRRYRNEGWPLVAALRRALLFTYATGGIGVILVLYACPKVG